MTPITLSLIFALLACQSKQSEIKMQDIDTIVTQIKTTRAPDSRIAIFEIEHELVDGIEVLTGETNLPEAYNELLAQLTSAKIDFKNQIVILPTDELGGKNYAIARLSVSNLRLEPFHRAELVTQVLLGTVLKVLKKHGYWYQVQTPEGYISWVDAGGITLMNEQDKNEWLQAAKVIFTEDYGFAYASSELTERISDLVAGDLLKLKVMDKKFFQVEFPDGRNAVIPNEEAQLFEEWLKSTHPKPENLVATAKRYIGLPYIFGGTSIKNLDCSGFTKTIYFLNGVILARDANQQANTGDPVDTENGFENLKIGDLMFFGLAATDSTAEKITHVGMYIGDTEFIHSSGIVRIDSIDPSRPNFSQYRYDGFIRAKRIITSLNKNGVFLIKNHPSYVSQ